MVSNLVLSHAILSHFIGVLRSVKEELVTLKALNTATADDALNIFSEKKGLTYHVNHLPGRKHVMRHLFWVCNVC